MEKTKLPFISVLSKNYQLLKTVFKYCKPLSIYASIYILCNVITNLLEVYLVSFATVAFVDGIEISFIIKKIAGIILILLINTLYTSFYNNYVEVKYRFIYIKKIQCSLFKKALQVDAKEYDNPEFYDRFSRALRDSQFRGFRVYSTIIQFINSIAVTIAIGGYIFFNDKILILIILLSSIICVIIESYISKEYYDVYKKTEIDSRFYWYVNRTFYQQKNAALIKTTPLKKLLIEKYNEKAKTLEEKYYRSEKKIFFLYIFDYASTTLLQYGLSTMYLAHLLIKKRMNVASFTALLTALTKFTNFFLEIARLFVKLREHARYIDDFIWIRDYEGLIETKGGITPPSFESLKIDNISFAYDDKEVIKNMSLQINKNDKIALVGYNGSGKTTLVKLLLHLYETKNGTIYYNDIPYDKIDALKLRNKISIVFQDYQVYSTSVLENVLMRKKESDEDERIALDALDKVGMKNRVLSLKDGINTIVTREFNESGEAFSGGERQRLAIARVFASNADIYILDEPTASLDPIAEEKINNEIISKATDKTIIIIAHRLSSVVDCDKIILLKDGKIAEQGTHKELLKSGKDYAEMFYSQKHLYEKEEKD